MQILQRDLERVRIEWNNHRLRPVRNSVCPSGHPNELYYLPQLLGKGKLHINQWHGYYESFTFGLSQAYRITCVR